jgi:STE24 endopeptidase
MDKLEKVFWITVILWVILRTLLMGVQIVGNTNPEMKKAVLGYFSQQEIDQGKNYALKGFYFKFFYGFLYVGILIFLLKTGIFTKIGKCIENSLGSNFWSELLFVVAFLGLVRLLSFPFSLYFGFFKESQMGFSNMNSVQWLIRFLKSSAVSISMETVGIMIILSVISKLPNAWPVVLPATMGVFSVAVTLLFPVLITPIFYEQKPLEDGSLKDKIHAIAAKANIKVEGIYTINESKYSNHTNAYFTGLGARKRIVLYDTLIKSHTEDEVSLIFAHEAGHWLHDHMLKGLTCGFLGMIAISLFYWWVFPVIKVVPWFGLKDLSSAANVPFIFIIVIMFQLFFAPIESQISQYMEKQADWAALELTGLTDTYVDAEKRLATDNKSDLLPHPFRVFWLYSHPPTIKRIQLVDTYNQSLK